MRCVAAMLLREYRCMLLSPSMSRTTLCVHLLDALEYKYAQFIHQLLFLGTSYPLTGLDRHDTTTQHVRSRQSEQSTLSASSPSVPQDVSIYRVRDLTGRIRGMAQLPRNSRPPVEAHLFVFPQFCLSAPGPWPLPREEAGAGLVGRSLLRGRVRSSWSSLWFRRPGTVRRSR